MVAKPRMADPEKPTAPLPPRTGDEAELRAIYAGMDKIEGALSRNYVALEKALEARKAKASPDAALEAQIATLRSRAEHFKNEERTFGQRMVELRAKLGIQIEPLAIDPMPSSPRSASPLMGSPTTPPPRGRKGD